MKANGLLHQAWLQWTDAQSIGRVQVDKAQAQFYELEVSQAHIDSGFVIGAHSAVGSKFKLLLFEKLPGGQWELLLQVRLCWQPCCHHRLRLCLFVRVLASQV